MAKKTIPAISIVIPMYNAEKYVGECLDSILAQTFDDYEVIVVDDGSTDNSVAIVESYMPAFNSKTPDKLALIKLSVNSGRPGTPRNVGISLALGEYIMFVDSDDAIIPTALEELYKFAKEFQVDVVHCEKFFSTTDDTDTIDINLLTVTCDENVTPCTEPIRVSDNVVDRVKEFGELKFIGFTWNRLIRRNLLIENGIVFPKIRAGHDHIFSFQVLCLANSILRVPKPYYIWRKNSTSISRAVLSIDKLIHRWTDSLFKGTKLIDEFMNRFEVFRKNAGYKHVVINTLIHHHTKKLFDVYKQVPAYQLDSLVRRELSEIDDTTALTAFLFNRMNVLNVNLTQYSQVIRKQQIQLRQQQATIQQLQAQLQQK